MQCEICNITISKVNWSTHLKTKKHRFNLELEPDLRPDNSEKKKCECGAIVDKYYYKYHIKSHKHINKIQLGNTFLNA